MLLQPIMHLKMDKDMFKKSRKKPKTETEYLIDKLETCSSQMPREEIFKVLSSCSFNSNLIDKLINIWEKRQQYYK